MISNSRKSMLHGILLIVLFSCAAFYIADIGFIRRLSLSPLIIGIILGMIYANSLRNNLPETWTPGIKFCTKEILRLGIILYGFRLTFQSVAEVGLAAIAVDLIVVTSTIFLGVWFGKLLKMDKDLSLLTATGSAICGAAAVLGAESVIKPQPYKTAVAVSTVVIFGTMAMFLYPAVFSTGVLMLETRQMGVYTGSTLHEVAHVVGAGNAMGPAVSDTAIIVKMIRVILLAPALIIMALVSEKRSRISRSGGKRKITIPWFALGFILVICFNSLDLLPAKVVEGINASDTFLLTMAMTALGAETNFAKFRQAGAKPFLLAAILFVWLAVSGWLMAEYLVPLL